MILLEDFYTFLYHEPAPGSVKAKISINRDHKILKGHFPGLPIVPGVCMMQMIKEILEQVIGKETNLTQAADMKFLAVINPLENNLIHASVKYTTDEAGAINIVASLFKDELVHFKCKAKLQQVSGH